MVSCRRIMSISPLGLTLETGGGGGAATWLVGWACADRTPALDTALGLLAVEV